MKIETKILNWYQTNKRDLPWRNKPKAYTTWLSEIILQQTRVQQGLPYYIKFLNRYSTIREFAEANEDDLLLLWQGLGYYSRVRNMHIAAQQVLNEYGGVFPTDYQSLKKLKGVGDYTAAAIASICYKEKVAVVDGNVYRVFSRLFGIKTPIDSAIGKKEFFNLAQELIKDCMSPGDYNQGVMELGSLVCTPKKPSCNMCPLVASCHAFSNSTQLDFPVKTKKVKITKRKLNYLLVQDCSSILIQQRMEKDIWHKLFEFILIEKDSVDTQLIASLFPQAISIGKSKLFKHKLSHQHIEAVFWEIDVPDLNEISWKKSFPIKQKDIQNYSIPKLLDNYLLTRNKK